ncbi:MAG: hypothetical protein WCI92_19335 [Bacteroidota bacterium]
MTKTIYLEQIRNQYTNHSNFTNSFLTKELTNKIIPILKNHKIEIDEGSLPKINDFVNQHKKLLMRFPIVVENSYREGIRLAYLNDIQHVKDLLFTTEKSKVEVLKYEMERFNIKFSNLFPHTWLYNGIVDVYSIRKTVECLIFDLFLTRTLQGLKKPPTNDELPTQEFFNNFICPQIQITAAKQWCLEQIEELTKNSGLVASETNSTLPDPLLDKMEQIKEKLKFAFEDDKHIDKILDAIKVYAINNTPDCVKNEIYNCENIKISSKEFYTPFKDLNKKTGITYTDIATVLHYFIHAGNGSQNAIKITAIIQNLKRKYD